MAKRATHLCPCGPAGGPDRKRTCGPAEVANYPARMSGPLADRIDMQALPRRYGQLHYPLTPILDRLCFALR